MSKREHRQYTADQKLEILREAEQPNVTISEVCRRHSLAPSVFYRWRAMAQNGSADALKQDARRRPGNNDQDSRREAELARLRAVIAEITAENLELKKRSEARRPVTGSGGGQSSGHADCRADEAAVGLVRTPDTLVAGHSTECVLQLAAT